MVLRRALREAAEHGALKAARSARNLGHHRTDGDARRAISREAVDARRDGGKCDRAELVLGRQRERRTIAAGQQLILATGAPVPDWADRVDHMASRQAMAGRDLGPAGAATIERSALGQEPRAGGAVNGARSEEHTSELQSLRHLVCRL